MADHALATITNPSAALTDFSLIVDLSRMPASWWSAVTSTDGTRGRVYKGDGTTRLPADWIDFDSVADTGLLRVKWTGTLATTGTQQLWIEPPLSGNAAVLASDTYGSDNAYDANWLAYWPDGGSVDRTSNGYDLTAIGSPTIGGGSINGLSATDYNGTTQYSKNSTLEFDGRAAITMQAWVNLDVLGGSVFGQWGGSASVQRLLLTSQIDGTILAGVRAGISRFPQSTGTFAALADAHIALTHVSGTQQLYLNSVADGSENATGSIVDPAGTEPTTVGSEDDGAGGLVNGRIGEVQAHSTNRSADWISSEYDQTNDQATFWGTWTWTTTGGGTPQELAGTLSAISALSGAIEITRTLSGALAGQSSAVGAIEVARTLAGVLAATSELSGDLSTVKLIDLAGTLEGSSSASGNILVERALSGTLSGTAEATAALQVIRELAGVLAGQAGASGDLQVGEVFEAVGKVSATITARMARATVDSRMARATVEGR